MLRFARLQRRFSALAKCTFFAVVLFFVVTLFTVDILDKNMRASNTPGRDLKTLDNIMQRLVKLEQKLSQIQKQTQLKTMNSTQDWQVSRKKKCTIPMNWRYPLCDEKVQWMRAMWHVDPKCYVTEHQVDPTNDCSLLRFLSEIEQWCPLLPGRERPNPLDTRPTAKLRTDKTQLIQMLQAEHYSWLRDRINNFWPSWVEGKLALEKRKTNLENRASQNIFVFMGAFAHEQRFFEAAYYGGPLGELVQWTDLLCTLYILGHNLTISANQSDLPRLLDVPKIPGCASKTKANDFDMVVTDYNGYSLIAFAVGPNHSQYRCRIRILDSFGTEAEFNYNGYRQPIPGGRSPWASKDIHLRQLMTMFPHSPDNTFLGFVVDAPTNKLTTDKVLSGNKAIGLVYGKESRFWQGKRSYLDTLNQFLEIHATTTGEGLKENVPDYVVNHGIISRKELGKLLDKAKVFIGLGFPYEGPAPLEAIAHGCVFLNVRLDPPHSRLNTEFFKTKPTLRALNSQHPYTETFIGEPYVYTVDISNTSQVEQTVKKILKTQVKPYLPLEWTPEGMLERFNSYLQYMDFCDKDSKTWPPIDQQHLLKAPIGVSCKDTCRNNGLVCEYFYFNTINAIESFKKLNISCKRYTYESVLEAPFVLPKEEACVLQHQPLLFSCVAAKPDKVRLCPCRDFQPQQVALCKACS